QALAGGAFGALLLAIGGNLYAPAQLLRGGQATIAAFWWDKQIGIGWRASRIVCDGPRIANDCRFPSSETINEFPFFSFLLGDLHPHVMALPIVIAALTLSLRWLIAPAGGERRVELARAAATGLVVGSLYTLNSWDYPTLLAATLAAVWLGNRAAPRRVVVNGVAIAAVSLIGWLPFWARFAPPTGGHVILPGWAHRVPLAPLIARALGMHMGERTSLGEYLTIFGVPVAIGLTLLVVCLAQRRRVRGGFSLDLAWLAPAAAIAVLGIGLDAPVLVLAGWAALGGLHALSRAGRPSPFTVVTGLFTLGAAMSATVELFYIRDVFENRMNTLFKVYYQVWTLYMLAAAVAAILLWRAIDRGAVVARVAYVVAGGAVVAAALVYPLLASWQWTEHFTTWRGLDGIAYAAARYPDERAAIQFLRDRAALGDVLLEAAGCSYQPNGDLPFDRMSAYTGVPTVIGWGNHEAQWRAGEPDLLAGIAIRQADVARMYGQPDSPLIDDYAVTWLVVGRYERGDWQAICPVAGPYPGIDRPGFPGADWDLAFQRGDVAIYRRANASPADG
ncbi:MAG: hypothetical protein IT337_13800, partial [Thermomicrobiales bacterium]|nr:hypothetical protein [Thermomicrobiales bacterium]